MDQQHKLVDEKTGKTIEIDTEVRDFRGNTWILTDWTAPRSEPSSGHVYLRDGGTTAEYYPSVIGAKIIPVD